MNRKLEKYENGKKGGRVQWLLLGLLRGEKHATQFKRHTVQGRRARHSPLDTKKAVGGCPRTTPTLLTLQGRTWFLHTVNSRESLVEMRTLASSNQTFRLSVRRIKFPVI